MRDAVIILTSLALIGSGAWAGFAGLLTAMFPDALDIRESYVPELAEHEIQIVGIGAMLIGLALFFAGSSLAVQVLQ